MTDCARPSYMSAVYVSTVFFRDCGQFAGISTETANPSLVGCSTVSSLMYTAFVLTRVLDAKHISDKRFKHSFHLSSVQLCSSSVSFQLEVRNQRVWEVVCRVLKHTSTV